MTLALILISSPKTLKVCYCRLSPMWKLIKRLEYEKVLIVWAKDVVPTSTRAAQQ